MAYNLRKELENLLRDRGVKANMGWSDENIFDAIEGIIASMD